jgi:hypothetical protein
MHTVLTRFGLVLVLTLAFFTAAGVAADHTQLTPLLVDLKGWEADQAGGMTMDMGSSKMINAARDYRQGDKEIKAMVMLGNQAMTQGSMQDIKAENAEGKMSIKTIDGFKVMSQHSKTEKSGAVIVYLRQGQQQGAIFTLVYDGLTEEEGLNAAKKFSWKEMKKSVADFF